MKIRMIQELPKTAVTQFFTEHWGSTEMVISSGVFRCDELDGFAALQDDEIIGMITYVCEVKDCEIISLDSVVENKGVGSMLVEKVEQTAKHLECQRVKLITTNDNLHALGFYQKRGYRMIEVLPQAVDKARQQKPEIPLTAANGIPIHDELVLEKVL